MQIFHPDDPVVAAARVRWDSARIAYQAHVQGCQACTEHNPMSYTICSTGHQLAMDLVARALYLGKADGEVSASSGDVPLWKPRPPAAASTEDDSV